MRDKVTYCRGVIEEGVIEEGVIEEGVVKEGVSLGCDCRVFVQKVLQVLGELYT